MIVDFDSVADGETLVSDLCIIGAGAAGLSLAREFIGSRTNVIIVESGADGVEAAFEQLNEGKIAGIPFVGLEAGRRRGLGGTTAAWGGQCCELDAGDFQMRSWVPQSGWPLTQDDLVPYYRRAESVFGVAGERYDEAIWKRFGIEPIRFDQTGLRTSFSVFSPRPRIGRYYRKLFAGARNMRVVLRATVTNIRTNITASQVARIDVKGLEGRTASICARAFVLCTGAIESARLLLLSRDSAPAGLGNDRDLVGRYFQDHPTSRTALVAPDATNRIQDAYGILYSGRTWYWPKISLAPQLQRAAGTLNGAGFVMFEYDSAAVEILRHMVRTTRTGGRYALSSGRLATLVRGAPAVADAGFRRYVLGRSPRARPAKIELVCTIEQAPNYNSRITLADTRDRLGSRQARVDWKITDAERHTFRVLTTTIQAEFKRLALADIIPEAWLNCDDASSFKLWDNYHQTGTTRMSNDPASGVVNANAQVYGIDGLFIAGAPTFPTSGYANPVLTIAALSIRLADHLKRTYFR